MNAAGTAAEQLYALASEVLARRWRGLSVDAPDWLCRDAVRALTLSLDPRRQAGLQVVLQDGVSARALPRSFGGLPLEFVRAPFLQAQRSTPSLTLVRTLESGTATALVRDRLNGQRCYLMTCGHVVAPDDASRFGDRVSIGLPAGNSQAATLCEWQPDSASGAAPSPLDAALVEIDSGALQVLNQLPSDWLPQGLSDATQAGQTVSMQRAAGGALAGVLTQSWSGEVSLGNSQVPSYFLQDGIGYIPEAATLGGDSGAPLWTGGDLLMGMHIGALGSQQAPAATAVMARVKPALDWYCVKPFTRQDPATLTAADMPTLPLTNLDAVPTAVQLAADQGDVNVLAETLWGEARGEGPAGMEAVAAVVLNRRNAGYRGCHTATQVCHDPRQFSCWNADDPNSLLLSALPRQQADPVFPQAVEIARRALTGGLIDPTRGAKHYIATSLPLAARPLWLLGKVPCVVIGRHAFYNDIL